MLPSKRSTYTCSWHMDFWAFFWAFLGPFLSDFSADYWNSLLKYYTIKGVHTHVRCKWTLGPFWGLFWGLCWSTFWLTIDWNSFLKCYLVKEVHTHDLGKWILGPFWGLFGAFFGSFSMLLNWHPGRSPARPPRRSSPASSTRTRCGRIMSKYLIQYYYSSLYHSRVAVHVRLFNWLKWLG